MTGLHNTHVKTYIRLLLLVASLRLAVLPLFDTSASKKDEHCV